MRDTSKRRDNGIQGLLGSGRKTKAVTAPTDHPINDAIARMEKARAELENFRQQHAETIEQYELLRNEVSAAIESAKELYTQHKDELGPSYGGFSVMTKRYVNADLLIELEPEIGPLLKYSMSVGVLDDLVISGIVDSDVAEKVIYTKDAVSGPKA